MLKEKQYFPTVHGNFYLPSGDSLGNDPVAQAMMAHNLFEPAIIAFCAKHITSGSTVIDAGANWGQMTVAFSRLVGETGFVHSIESSSHVLEHLRATLEANPECKNVTLHPNAGWHTSGEDLNMLIPHSTFAYSGAGIRGVKDPRDNPVHAVKSLAIDDIEFQSPVSVIKIDAQGSDFFILKGAKKTLEKYRPIVVLEYEPEYEPWFDMQRQDLIDFLESVNYTEIGSVENNNHDLIFWPKDRWIEK
jgi:FkbM family methyltransferase